MKAVRLNSRSLREAVRSLEAGDSDLASVGARFGPPPLWARKESFATLLYIILEQQVSLASARAAFDKLRRHASPLTPSTFLRLSDGRLKAFGFSRRKASYGRHLAGALVDGRLDLASLADLDDASARAQLMRIKGIGPWTADIDLLRALGRPDVWPSGDLAIALAVQRLRGRTVRPSPAALDAIGKAWQPWRSVAARILWHYYLNDRGTVTGRSRHGG